MRATASDVAKKAGVSLATVDRVLNGRPGVRPGTIMQVNSAIDDLGYVRDSKAATLARNREVNILFVIPDGPGTFMRSLPDHIEQFRPHFLNERVNVQVEKVPAVDTVSLARALDLIDVETTDGVVVVATDGNEVRRAIRRLHDAAVPVVTLISDSPTSPRSHFVGIDNIAAGRSAAHLMGRFLTNMEPQKVAIIVGSMLLRDHVDRVTGFQQVVAENQGHLELLKVIEGQDESDRVEALTLELLGKNPNLKGIYCAAAGVKGAISALETTNKDQSIVAVVHELSTRTRQALEEGTLDVVLNQDAGHEVRSAIRIVTALVNKQPIIASQERIRLDIFIRDNLP